MHRLSPVIAACAIALGAAPLAHADEDSEPPGRKFFSVSYGLGLNLWPRSGEVGTTRFHDISLAYGAATSPEVRGGGIEFEASWLNGHADPSDSEVLLGLSVRGVPHRNLYFRLRAAFGAMGVVKASLSDRSISDNFTGVLGIYAGLAKSLPWWDNTIEVGWVIGDHKDNGYINLLEARVGFEFLTGGLVHSR
jgi:hypothetical protein